MAHPNTPPTLSGNTLELIAAWLLVGIPLAWGVFVTAGNALALFR
jgi:hypothetical protein